MSPDVETYLQQLLEAGDFDKIAPFLDNAELESLELDPLNKWPIALHLLAHVYNDDLLSVVLYLLKLSYLFRVNARFLWKRIPSIIEKSEETEAAWTVVQVFWNRCFCQYLTSLTTPEWSPTSKLLADAIASKSIKSALLLISKSYTIISTTKLSTILGCPPEVALEYVKEAGWKLIDEDHIEVIKTRNSSLQMVPQGQLQKLAEILTHLES